MGSSIEWGSARACSTYVLGHTEEAGDHQSVSDDSDNPDEIGLMFSAGGDGYCLTGTPEQIIAALTGAITAVALYRPEEPVLNPGTIPSVGQLVDILASGERRVWLDPDDTREMARDVRAALTEESRK